jgi:hypothetical protein
VRGSYTSPIDGTGQASSVPLEPKGAASVEDLLARVTRLTDEDRARVAEARKAVDESFHADSLAAASELLVGRGEAYARARSAVAAAHLPAVLDDEGLEPDERARWGEIARLVEAALDDALLAFLTNDVLHPNHARELYRSLKAIEPVER